MNKLTNQDHVIQVAAELFRYRGLSNTAMDDVVKQSGVSKSNIYYHFKSKDDLTLAVLEAYISTLETSFQKLFIESHGSLIEKTKLYTNMLIEELAERGCIGGCPLLSLMVEAGRTNEQVRVRLEIFFEQQVDHFTQLIQQGAEQGEIRNDLPANMLASIFSSWLEGMLMLISIKKNVDSFRKERDTLLKMLQPTSKL
ncbi:TetR/AcrR family transcriptional regulator [Shimazuella sp. AN120528]|uniref:TetR/AcrR family transcriptional regulator n=1 Tax=Shimazuella soli TaxID=1892854 RepID=UPI001F106DA4|nr:TetR/AcrR family transcriptional regulator [Shimazuella soli]MCH5584432.1 TetR/AcrR family transcriptional regulator [Shimazuella soli]